MVNWYDMNLESLERCGISYKQLCVWLLDGKSFGDIGDNISSEYSRWYKEQQDELDAAQRLREEREAERLEAERRAEEERLEAERRAEEERLAEERRLEAERLEAERLEAERRAAEEAAKPVLFQLDDFVGSADEFEKAFNLQPGYYGYYERLRKQMGLKDREIWRLFCPLNVFGTDTTAYNLWHYFRMDVQSLINGLLDNEKPEKVLINLVNMDMCRNLVQTGIEKEENRQEFYIALYAYFIIGKAANLFDTVDAFTIDFHSNENVWAFFANEKIYHYFNLVDTRLEQNMLWSNMNKMLDVRNKFTKIVKNVNDYFN